MFQNVKIVTATKDLLESSTKIPSLALAASKPSHQTPHLCLSASLQLALPLPSTSQQCRAECWVENASPKPSLFGPFPPGFSAETSERYFEANKSQE